MEPSITCPVCHRTSYNQFDINYKYCGYCHDYYKESRPRVKLTLRICCIESGQVYAWCNRLPDSKSYHILVGHTKEEERI